MTWTTLPEPMLTATTPRPDLCCSASQLLLVLPLAGLVLSLDAASELSFLGASAPQWRADPGEQ